MKMRRNFVDSWAIVMLALTAVTSSIRAEGTLETLDIVFLMDASASIGSTGWENEKDFIDNYILIARAVNSRIAIIRFDTFVTVEFAFSNDQSDSIIRAVVNNLNHTRGDSHLRDAMYQAIDLFTVQSASNYDRLIVFLTDGVPNPSSTQNPCVIELINTLGSLRINTVVVGVGTNWNPQNVACLVASHAEHRDIVEVTNTGTDFLDFDRFRVGGHGNGDFTGDLIIDLDDHIEFLGCLENASWPDCNLANFVGLGGVVDLADFAQFQRIFKATPKEP